MKQDRFSCPFPKGQRLLGKADRYGGEDHESCPRGLARHRKPNALVDSSGILIACQFRQLDTSTFPLYIVGADLRAFVTSFLFLESRGGSVYVKIPLRVIKITHSQ